MLKPHDFFISHCSKDNHLALDLKAAFLMINPEWDVFLDCDAQKPLEKENEWRSAMLSHAQNSKYLIFLATDPKYLKKGEGWLYEEVSTFHGRCATRFRDNRADRTIEYFGIIFGDINLQTDLYSDSTQGNDYFSLYNFRQHILLDRNESIQDAFNRIKVKVLNMEQQNNDLSAELLDKVLDYTHRRQEKDEMFSLEAIDELLLPNLFSTDRSSGGTVSVSFEELCSKMKDSHVVISGEQGGCGKTTLMTRIFFHHLHAARVDEADTMIPLFIDARVLTGKNNLILRHLAETLYKDYTAKGSSYTGEYVTKLSGEFQRENDHPRYLLLIDGYNELPADSLTKFNRELKDYCKNGIYPNTQVVLSGRTLEQHILSDDLFYKLTIGKLCRNQVVAYLEQFQQTHNHIKRFLRKVKTKKNEEYKGLYQCKKIESLIETLETPLFSKLFVETADTDQSQNRGELMRQYMIHQDRIISNSNADEEVKAFNQLCLYHFLPAISRELTANTATSQYAFTEKELRAMIKKATALMFSENYRDYYQKQYRDCLKISLPSKDAMEITDQFMDHMLKHSKLLRECADDTYEFIHQVYQEFFCAYYIAEDVKRALKDHVLCDSLLTGILLPDVCGFVASLLGETELTFARKASETEISDSVLPLLLDVARAHPETDTSCYVANVIALMRTAWQNDLAGVNFSGLDLTKSDLRTCMLARKTNTGLLAANFRGARIHAENLLNLGHCQPIRTACASKNYIATCDTFGTIMLWERNSCSDVPIRIIDEAGSEFSRLLFAPDEKSLYAMSDECIQQILIPDEYRSDAVQKVLLKTSKRFWDIKLDERGELYFSTAMNPFHFKAISRPEQPDRWNFTAVNSCAAINNTGTYLAFSFTPSETGLRLFRRNLKTDDWQELVHLPSAVSDGHIRSVSWNPRSDILLVAISRPHMPEADAADSDTNTVEWKNSVVELDPETMHIHLVEEYNSKKSVAFFAQYSDDCILVNNHGRIIVYDQNFEIETKITYSHSWIGSFVFLGKRNGKGDEGNVCAVSKDNIYQLDKNDRCIAAWRNDLDEMNLLCCTNEKGVKYLVGKKAFEHKESLMQISFLRLDDGSVFWISKRNFYQFRAMDYSSCDPQLPKSALRQGKRTYQYNSGKILCYRTDVLTKEIDVYYKLFICGCDFRGIRGSLSYPEYLRLLDQYGAQTDGFAPAVYPSPVELPEILPSQTPFLPEQTPFLPIQMGEPCLDDRSSFLWEHIQNAMSEPDYSMLERMVSLDVVTPEIICQLMKAGLICRYPGGDASEDTVIARMRKWEEYGLIYRPVSQPADLPAGKRLYTLTKQGGQALLQRSIAPKTPHTTLIDDPMARMETLFKRIKTSRWFAMTAQTYAQYLTDHALYNTFDSKLHMSARGRINGYLKLGEQAFFAEPVQQLHTKEEIYQIKDKTRRMGSLAVCHRHLNRYENGGWNRVLLSRAPILIFLCSDFEHSRTIHSYIAPIFPNVRKLYTYDALLEEGYSGLVYFEFVGDQPYAVDLADLIQAD